MSIADTGDLHKSHDHSDLGHTHDPFEAAPPAPVPPKETPGGSRRNSAGARCTRSDRDRASVARVGALRSRTRRSSRCHSATHQPASARTQSSGRRPRRAQRTRSSLSTRRRSPCTHRRRRCRPRRRRMRFHRMNTPGSTTSKRGPATVGVRSTKQRSAISALLDDIDEFKSAQELHDELRKRGEGIGLTTVYRTLQALSDAGTIDVLRTDTGESVYRRCSSGQPPSPGVPQLRIHRRGRGARRSSSGHRPSPRTTVSPM